MKQEIQKFFKGDVEDDEVTLVKYSHDASLLEVMPKLVVFPKDSTDVQNLVKWVNENKDRYPDLSITARCAGTDMSGGAIGESIIMDFTRHMNKLIGGPLPLENQESQPVQPQNTNIPQKPIVYPTTPSYITVQPGMFYRDFEKITLAKGLILPCYTASKSLNAMGGMYGNNSAGERTLKYGKTEDYVLSAKVVLSDGEEYFVEPLSSEALDNKMEEDSFESEIYKNVFNLIDENKTEIARAKPRVRKNSAGYYLWNIVKDFKATPDTKNLSAFLHPTGGPFRETNSLYPTPLPNFFDLNKLLVGSQGTLSIATEITFKLLPENKYSKLVVIFMDDLTPLGGLVDEILELKPETLESYDDKTMKLAVRFFPDFLKNKGWRGMIKFMWSFLPEVKMMATGGFPKLILLAEFAGRSEEEVDRRCEELKEKVKHFNLKVHITKNEAESSKYWDIRRESFALLRKHVSGKRTAPFIDDIIVRPEFLPKFIPELNTILEKYKNKMTYTLAGHAGDGNFHIIPLMNFSRPDTAKIILELGEQVYDLVLRYHGSITAEHNDGLIRTPYLRKMYGDEIVDIFKQVKNIFDPKNIFNPGKKVATENAGGTKTYIAEHIAHEHDAKHAS